MSGYKITVYGKVQKVWFRKYTQEKAIALNLTGYVMNQKDGTVCLEAFGGDNNLKRLLLWLETQGSPLSEVDRVEVEEITTTITYKNFIIKR